MLMKNIIKRKNIRLLFVLSIVLIILTSITSIGVAYSQYTKNDKNGTVTNGTNKTPINDTNINKKTVSIDVQIKTGKGSMVVYRNNKSIGIVNNGDEVKTFIFETWDRFRFEAMLEPGYNSIKFCPEEDVCYTDNPFVGTIAAGGNLSVYFGSDEDIQNNSDTKISEGIVTQTIDKNEGIATKTIDKNAGIAIQTIGKDAEKSPAISSVVSICIFIILVLRHRKYKR